ncbi:PEP-utilizing enzyme [Nitrincola sp.]|uniref:PEP-utilizing enzyme n=1 Tax=Nitrincola sp. TaxID=1926584 RepID=UPI003A8F3521
MITESGGPLSHGAVTARELQLPAVMSVRGVMTRLENGMQVQLDGKTGVVRILQ